MSPPGRSEGRVRCVLQVVPGSGRVSGGRGQPQLAYQHPLPRPSTGRSQAAGPHTARLPWHPDRTPCRPGILSRPDGTQ
jgi:hypothetical protein